MLVFFFFFKNFPPNVEQFDSFTVSLRVDSDSNGVRMCRGPNLRRMERLTKCKPIREAPVRRSCPMKPRSPHLPIISVRPCQTLFAASLCSLHLLFSPTTCCSFVKTPQPLNSQGIKHPVTGTMQHINTSSCWLIRFSIQVHAEEISGNNGYVELSFCAKKLDDKVRDRGRVAVLLDAVQQHY